jgi:hypothetical protein
MLNGALLFGAKNLKCLKIHKDLSIRCKYYLLTQLAMNLNAWSEFLPISKNRVLRNSLLILIVFWMAAYPIYSSFYKAYGVDQYRRHQMHMQANSMFFNPWQYRILCPLIIEGLYWTAEHTLFSLVEIKGLDLGLPGDNSDKNATTQSLIEQLKNPEFIKYTIVFLGFRFLQNVLLIILCFKYFSLFVKNKMLVALGVMLSVLFMGNGVVDSDLTFNTYMDITLYILAGIVIVKNLNPLWIIPLTVVGSLNRETALFIPVLYFFTYFTWADWPSIKNLITNNLKVIGVTSISVVFFFIIFISIRMYYGLQPVSTWRVNAGWPMLKLNLFSSVSIKTYMELFGIMGFLPLWALLIFSRMHKNLRIFFLVLIPVWFGIHFVSAIAYQTRLFLVPTLLVLVPAILENIEKSYGQLTRITSTNS